MSRKKGDLHVHELTIEAIRLREPKYQRRGFARQMKAAAEAWGVWQDSLGENLRIVPDLFWIDGLGRKVEIIEVEDTYPIKGHKLRKLVDLWAALDDCEVELVLFAVDRFGRLMDKPIDLAEYAAVYIFKETMGNEADVAP